MKNYKCTYEHVEENTKDHGWFRDQLILTESIINGRWSYWWAICLNRTIGKLPEWAIPQINFLTCTNDDGAARCIEAEHLKESERGQQVLKMIGTAKEARKHLFDIVESCLMRGDYLQQLIDWWLFAFGSSRIKEKPRVSEHTAITLYTELELQRLIGNPADWGAALGLEFLGRTKDRSGWFPTPANVARMIVQMTFGNEDCRTKSVCDPCVGTGIFLLEASNYSLNLYGIDIDPLMVSLCEFAGWLFIPWLVYGNKQFIKEFREKEQVDEAFEVDHSNNQLVPTLLPGQKQGVLFSRL